MSAREFIGASEVPFKEGYYVPERGVRLFRVSDELAARSLGKWSEPLRARLVALPDGTYDLVMRHVADDNGWGVSSVARAGGGL